MAVDRRKSENDNYRVVMMACPFCDEEFDDNSHTAKHIRDEHGPEVME